MTDYCDTCKEFNENLRHVCTTRNRKIQSGSSEPIEIEMLEKQLEDLEKELKQRWRCVVKGLLPGYDEDL